MQTTVDLHHILMREGDCALILPEKYSCQAVRRGEIREMWRNVPNASQAQDGLAQPVSLAEWRPSTTYRVAAKFGGDCSI
jgi:hypothetical protein